MADKEHGTYEKALAGALLEIYRSIKLNVDELSQDKGESYTQGLVGGYRSCLEYVAQNMRSLGLKPDADDSPAKANALFAALCYGFWLKRADGTFAKVEPTACALKCDARQRLGLAIEGNGGKTLFLPDEYGITWALAREELQ